MLMIQKVSGESSLRPQPPTQPTRATILVEVAADGFIKVYGHKHIQAKIINRPSVATSELGCQVDELIDNALPVRYREIYYPNNIRATGKVKRTKPSDILRISHELEILNSIGTPSRYYTDSRSRILAAMEG